MEVRSEPQALNLRILFSQSRRVLKSQRPTFIALAFLFLFPTAIAAVLFPAITKSLSPEFAVSSSAIPVKLALFLFSLVITPCAVGSITFTAFHGFHGEPVKLKAAIKSIAASFFPLLATILASQLIIFAASYAFVLLVTISTTTKAFLRLDLFLSLPYLLVFGTAMFVILMVYLQVNWTLTFAVVVAESSWGFAPLKRSKELTNGKRGIALCVSLIFGILNVFFLWDNWYAVDYAATLGGASRPSTAAEWRSFFFYLTFRFLFTSVLLMLTQLGNLIVNTVLYVYCAALNVAGGEFSGEYFSLSVDDEKVASVV